MEPFDRGEKSESIKINKVELLIWEEQLTLSQTSPRFYVSAVSVFWKHWKEDVARKEQFLLFQHYFYRHLGEFSTIFIKFEIVVCKLFQYGTI